MDSKFRGEDPPPAYESIQHGATGATAENFSPSSVTQQLRDHLTSLPSRIRDSRLQAITAQQRLDDTMIVHIAPVINDFLAVLGRRANAPPLASLTIVPDRAIPAKAQLSGLEDMDRRGEIGEVSRVELDGLDGDEKKKRPAEDSSSFSYSYSSAFDDPRSDEDDKSLLWWRDEEMAHRLANYLRPQTEGRFEANPSAVQAVVEQEIPPEKERRGLRKLIGSGKRSPRSAGARAAAIAAADIDGSGSRPGGATSARERGQGGARMTVEAQEVAFRVVNDLNIVESKRGWAIVVTVKFD